MLTQTFHSINSSKEFASEHQLVLGIVKQWNQAFAQNQPENYFAYLHEDISLFVASSPYRCVGLLEDREEFEWSLKKGKTHVQFFQEIEPHIQLFENTAIVTYYTRGVYGEEGSASMVYLKETNVLVRENGGWKIVHIHVSK